MEKLIVVDIGSSGSVQALHDDDFPLSELGAGEVSMTRASLIEWNESTQKWDVRLPNWAYPISRGFNSYTEARDFEIAWLNKCRLAMVDPGSPSGIDMALLVRGEKTPGS